MRKPVFNCPKKVAFFMSLAVATVSVAINLLPPPNDISMQRTKLQCSSLFWSEYNVLPPHLPKWLAPNNNGLILIPFVRSALPPKHGTPRLASLIFTEMAARSCITLPKRSRTWADGGARIYACFSRTAVIMPPRNKYYFSPL